ncbi:MAG TPA: hypothetical protein VMQ76_03795 [Terracidiphilus sp.]|jgi:hypothetical protein|nr:hypothetical protein [Terracidiphilus sp.]
MEPGDLVTLWQIAAAQNRRDGTKYPFPPVFNLAEGTPGFAQLLQNVPLALTTERDGRVRSGTVFLRTIEAMHFGGGREDMEFDAGHIPLAFDMLRRMGYDDVHIFVPPQRVSDEHRQRLESYGLTRLDQGLAHFFRML